VSYNGVLDTLGQSQVVPYLVEILRDGHDVRVLSFERKSKDLRSIQNLQKRLCERGLKWTWLPYHKNPPVLSTLWDVTRGLLTLFWLTWRHKVQVLHARSQVAAAMVWPVARLLRRRFIFDLRGQMAYEYADGGTWAEGGFLYRLAERAEQRFIKDADAIVVLTRVLANDLKVAGARPPVIIPTCVDLDLFQFPLPGDRLARMAYCGSLGARYAPELLVAFYLEAARAIDSLDLLILTHSESTIMKRVLTGANLLPERFTILEVPHERVPEYLMQALFGVLLLRGARSLRGACPTKVGEYLAAGLPVVSTPGIGDVNDILEGERVGIVLQGHDTRAFSEGACRLAQLLKEGQTLRDRCRRVAEKEFSLSERGGPSYRALYRRLESRL